MHFARHLSNNAHKPHGAKDSQMEKLQIQTTGQAFPSGNQKLDALALFLGAHCLDTGSHLKNAYGEARVFDACQTFVEAIEAGESYDPFQDDSGKFVVCQVTVSTDRSWVDAALSKSLADVKSELFSRRLSEGPIADDDVPDWFDSIGFGSKIEISSVTLCSATLWIWWEAF